MAKNTRITVLTSCIWFALYENPYQAVTLFRVEFHSYVWNEHDSQLTMIFPTPKGDIRLPI